MIQDTCYSQAIAPFWDLQVGVWHDFHQNVNRTGGLIGLQGLAPYLFEIDTALRLNVEYELLFTWRLILIPGVGVNFCGESDVEFGVGSGLSDVEAGLRLRYEIRREFDSISVLTGIKI